VVSYLDQLHPAWRMLSEPDRVQAQIAPDILAA
jgi:hypothetical protein